MQEYRIENYLTEGEEIVWHGKPKENDCLTCKILHVLPAIILWLAAECIILGYAVSNKIFGKDFNVYYLIMTIAAVLLHLIPTVIWFLEVARKNAEINAEEYAVTNKNVIIMHGKFHQAVEIVPLKDIEDVTLERSVANRIMNTGSVILVTDEEKIRLQSQEDALKAYRRVYRAIKGGEEQ